jgi:acetyltransferase EpsM
MKTTTTKTIRNPGAANRLAILGMGGHAEVVADIARLTGWTVVGCYDDAEKCDLIPTEGCSGEELRWLGKLSAWQKDADGRGGWDAVVCAIGDNVTRHAVTESGQDCAPLWATLVHPSAVVADGATIGEGTVICACAVVCACASVGAHCIINTASSVDHHCRVGDVCHIAPGVRLCGRVTVGQGSMVGVGSSVLPGISIGRWAVVGAGSVVLGCVGEGETRFGIVKAARGGVA